MSVQTGIAKCWATAFGLGYSPVAPGTAGALGGLGLLWFLNTQNAVIWPSDHLFFWLAVLFILITGALSANYLKPEWGKDPSRVVIDEWLGMWIAMSGVAFTLHTALAGLILFRFFDIAKPLGIRAMEKPGRGWGVMLDDLLAGIYASVILRTICFLGWL